MVTIRFFLAAIYPTLLFTRLIYTDIRSKEVENIIILALLPCALLSSEGLALRLLGMAFPLLLIPFFGFGDVLLFAVLGFCLGVRKLCIVFCAATLLAGVFCAFCLAVKKLNKKSSIAFVPFIFLGCLLLMICDIIF